jgi:hypothetical protein
MNRAAHGVGAWQRLPRLRLYRDEGRRELELPVPMALQQRAAGRQRAPNAAAPDYFECSFFEAVPDMTYAPPAKSV